MTPFDIATADIFTNADFIETALFGEQSIPVIASEIAEDPALGDFGLDEGVSFFLRIRTADAAAIARNDLITFRGQTFRVKSATLDAAGLAWRVYLTSKSTR